MGARGCRGLPSVAAAQGGDGRTALNVPCAARTNEEASASYGSRTNLSAQRSPSGLSQRHIEGTSCERGRLDSTPASDAGGAQKSCPLSCSSSACRGATVGLADRTPDAASRSSVRPSGLKGWQPKQRTIRGTEEHRQIHATRRMLHEIARLRPFRSNLRRRAGKRPPDVEGQIMGAGHNGGQPGEGLDTTGQSLWQEPMAVQIELADQADARVVARLRPPTMKAFMAVAALRAGAAHRTTLVARRPIVGIVMFRRGRLMRKRAGVLVTVQMPIVSRPKRRMGVMPKQMQAVTGHTQKPHPTDQQPAEEKSQRWGEASHKKTATTITNVACRRSDQCVHYQPPRWVSSGGA